MKTKIFLFAATFFISTVIFAQKVVALHSPVNGVQYFTDDNPLQSAYAAAEVVGDTIYLPGGSMSLPYRFEKSIVIYGAGHYPSATTATYKTILSGNFRLGDDADDFYLEGVEISGSIIFDTNVSVNNVTIKRCKFNDLNSAGNRTNPAENNSFIENVYHTMYIDNMINSSFFNNIITGSINAARNLIYFNNLFIAASYYGPIGYANNTMFKNNIFLTDGIGICGGAGTSTWSHNIFCTSTTSPGLGVDPILDTNYFMTRADVLINQTGGNFDYTHDYHLTAAALLNLGDDGLQTGVYGGFYPWKDFSIPVNPHISSKTISNVSDANGMIQVNISVHSQDH